MISLAALRDIKVLGHRGACAYAPENTMSSFSKALACGVRWVEFDVMLAACGTPIIFHDETIDRTTNGKGDVSQYTYNQLKEFDAGSWFAPRFHGERIPSLIEMMNHYMTTPLSFNVEIKPLPGQDEETVINILDELTPFLNEANHRFLFSSFSLESLQYLRNKNPTLNLGLLLHEWLPGWEEVCRQLNCISVHVNHEILTSENIQEIKSRSYALFSYTVNEAVHAKNLYDMGVDAVFSDYPDKIINHLALTHPAGQV